VGASLSTTRISSVGEGGIAAGAGEASLLLLAVLLLLLLFLPRGHVGVRARNFTLGPSGLRLRMGRSDDCGLNLVIAFRLVFSRMASMSCCTGVHQPTMQSLLETNKQGKGKEWTDETGRKKKKEGVVAGGFGTECETHRFLASSLLGAHDHETPVLPYEYHYHGERHAACNAARNRADGHSRVAAP